MTKYPNREVLRKSHDIYRDAMREFIFQYLEKRVKNETVDDLIIRVLNREQHRIVDIKDIAIIFKNRECWNNFFSQQFGYDPLLGRHGYDIRSVTSLIVMGRNKVAHPGSRDLDSEYTNTHLFLIAEVLGKVGKMHAKREVEDVWDELFADDTDERLADMTKQLEAVKAKKTELEKQVKTTSDRLEEVEAERIACDKRLETVSTRLKIAVAGKTVAEERLSDISNQLEEAARENTAHQEHIETIQDQLEAANAEKAKYEKAPKATSNQLATLKRKNAQLVERLETKSTQLEDVKKELAACKERQKEPLPPNPNPPDSITFQGTTLTRHLNEYYVTGDDISQGFWHYWQSQGREGKQEMRDAGWSVEKVDEEWEVAISPEDFQAWIVDEITELNNLLDFLTDGESSTGPYEKVSLPAAKEMAKPALTVLLDGKEHRRVEIIDYLTEHFSLTDDERSYLSKTGQSEKHLMNEGLIERTRTGYYRITTRGRRKVRTR